VVILTAYGTVEGAIEAVRAGASDFLLKPVEIPRLRAAVFKGAQGARMRREIERLREETGGRSGSRGSSDPPARWKRFCGRSACRSDPDERPDHRGKRDGEGAGRPGGPRLSPRADRPFLPLNCAAIPETLLESELFGHEKGAFTGATASRPGKFENAEGGTLFLDEVGDVSPSIQSKLLRAIEQKEVMRVGGSQVVHADVRIIAATNQDLKGRVEAKAFREDLYYRLNVFNIVVPPLRDRREDIPKLCDHFSR